MFKLCAFIVCLCFATAHTQGFNGGEQSWYCQQVLSDNCMQHSEHFHCGTDRHTYRNMCDLGQAHCKDNTVNLRYIGQCFQDIPSTTMTAAGIIHGSQVIMDYQCQFISHKNCTVVLGEKLCGTDGVTYNDFCDYEKGRCTHRELHVAKVGDC